MTQICGIGFALQSPFIGAWLEVGIKALKVQYQIRFRVYPQYRTSRVFYEALL